MFETPLFEERKRPAVGHLNSALLCIYQELASIFNALLGTSLSQPPLALLSLRSGPTVHIASSGLVSIQLAV